MSFSSYVAIGATAGLAVGTIGAAYYAGAAGRLERQDNLGAPVMALIAGGHFFGGPFIGAGIGAGLYGTKIAFKMMRTQPRPAQAIVAVFIATSIVSTAAYQIGWNRYSKPVMGPIRQK